LVFRLSGTDAPAKVAVDGAKICDKARLKSVDFIGNAMVAGTPARLIGQWREGGRINTKTAPQPGDTIQAGY
jgi:hypothetical protein